MDDEPICAESRVAQLEARVRELGRLLSDEREEVELKQAALTEAWAAKASLHGQIAELDAENARLRAVVDAVRGCRVVHSAECVMARREPEPPCICRLNEALAALETP